MWFLLKNQEFDIHINKSINKVAGETFFFFRKSETPLVPPTKLIMLWILDCEHWKLKSQQKIAHTISTILFNLGKSSFYNPPRGKLLGFTIFFNQFSQSQGLVRDLFFLAKHKKLNWIRPLAYAQNIKINPDRVLIICAWIF